MAKLPTLRILSTFTALLLSTLISLFAIERTQAQPVEQQQTRREIFREAFIKRLQKSQRTGENKWQGRNDSGRATIYQSAPTTSAVKVFESTLKSGSAHRILPYKLSVPAKKGLCSLVILSHGAGGSYDGSRNLVESWVDAGFACIQPLHEDSIKHKRSLGQSVNLRDSMNDANMPTKWTGRVQDIEDIINSLDSINKLCPWVQFDKNGIGLAGHSFGAFTAQLIAGVTPPQSACCSTFKDPRIKAVLLLSPQGVRRSSPLGFDDASAWSGLHMPVMVMTGSLDKGRTGEMPDWRLEPYKYSPAGSKFLVFLNNANHMTFAGSGNLPASGELLSQRIADGDDTSYLYPYIEKASSLFFRAFLNRDAGALKNLVTEKFPENIGYLETK